ncbi:MAG: hypothetical protein QGH42_04455 [Kiritimatiellia bacterium]|nr:hypothetical protein [Kiritimatiellia bacterium]MDP6809664.1 hypothetical protein [Kiritimatiellia bacterium]MDP7023486.1 hypothetical protein [Kiritimatiellia bacterium]
MSSQGNLKIAWTWEEWQRSRKARRAVTDRMSPLPVRRKRSSSDNRLRAAFNGQRGPDFPDRTQGHP